MCSLKDPKHLQAGSEDSDQTADVQVDLSLCPGCTCFLVGNAMPWLICNYSRFF